MTMEISFRNKKKLVILAIPIVLSLLILYRLTYGTNESIQPVAESDYVTLLEAAASVTKGNYESITTWQGELMIEEDNYLYGEMCRDIPIAPNDPSVDSNSIRRRVTSLVKFATDIQNDKLYTELIPTVKYKALDLERDVVVNEKYSPIISIVTSQEYLSYQPDHIYGYRRDRLVNGKLQGKAAFKMPLEKVKREQWGHVRDPRSYFFQGNRTTWDYLYALRDTITGVTDIPKGKAPQISMAIDGAGDNAKLRIKGGFHGNTECTDSEDAFVNIIVTLDSSTGFNMVRREVTDRTGKTLQTLDLTYERIGQVYVPKTVHFIIYRFTDQKKSFDSHITFTKSILNEPIRAETFTYRNLGLKDGERLFDYIQDRDYIYQNGELIAINNSKK